MAIFDGLTAAKAAFDVSKQVSDLFNHPDVKPDVVRGRLIQLQQHILNAQEALGEAREEIATLKEQLASKDELKELRNDMQFQADGEFFVRVSESSKDFIPYCPLCWSKDNLTNPLQTITPGYLRCNLHLVTFETESYKNRPKQEQNYRRRQRPPSSTSWMG